MWNLATIFAAPVDMASSSRFMDVYRGSATKLCFRERKREKEKIRARRKTTSVIQLN
jgi:hypothetical protein